MSPTGGAWSVAPAFGVLGLDPAFPFGGCSVLSKTMVKRMATRGCLAYGILSTHTVLPLERKSGVKPRALQSLAALIRGFCKSRASRFPEGQDV